LALLSVAHLTAKTYAPEQRQAVGPKAMGVYSTNTRISREVREGAAVEGVCFQPRRNIMAGLQHGLRPR